MQGSLVREPGMVRLFALAVTAVTSVTRLLAQTYPDFF